MYVCIVWCEKISSHQKMISSRILAQCLQSFLIKNNWWMSSENIPQHLEETGLESNSKLFLASDRIDRNRDFIRLITDYRELQYFYFFKYFGHFLCLRNRIFFHQTLFERKDFPADPVVGDAFFFLVGKSSTQKSTKRLTHVCTRYNCRFPAWHYDRPFLWMIINHGPNCVQLVFLWPHSF